MHSKENATVLRVWASEKQFSGTVLTQLTSCLHINYYDLEKLDLAKTLNISLFVLSLYFQ